MSTNQRPHGRKGEAGSTIIEGVLAALLLCLMMLGAGSLFGAQTTKALLNQRQRVGREWADTGLAQLAARARRAPSGKPRTEYGAITTCGGCEPLTNGSARKTATSGYGTEGEMSQQWAYGDGWADFIPPVNYGGMTLVGPTSSRGIAIGHGGDMVITENGWHMAHTHWGTLTKHQGGDRYRIEFKGGTWNYYRYRGTTRELLFTDPGTYGVPQPGFPMKATFWIYYEGNELRDMTLSGIFVDPNALPDGGSVTPGSACVAPYCDYVWAQPRQGGTVTAPFVLAPNVAAPSGAIRLFVRRFKVETTNGDWGLRKVSMALAETNSSQPFITNTTEINSNPTTP